MTTMNPTASRQAPDDPTGVFVLHRIGAKNDPRWLLGVEHDGRLATWTVRFGLPADDGEERMSERIADRPAAASDYEGPAPADRSDIDKFLIADRGHREVVEWSADRVVVRLFGAVNRGEFVLPGRPGAAAKIVRIGEVDEPWQPLIELGAPAEPVEEPPRDDVEWVHEPYWRGRRAWFMASRGDAVVCEPGGPNLADALPELDGLATASGADQLVLDGVLVTFDAERRPDRRGIDERLGGSSPGTPVVYVAVDALQLDGRDLRQLPYRYRTGILDDLGLDAPNWIISTRWEDTTTAAALEAARSAGLDAVVAKRHGAPYGSGGPTGNWRLIRT